MVAACADPVAVGVTEDGDGAGAQAATSMSRHRLNQRICRQATKETCIGVLLSCVLGRGSSPRALPVRCRVIGHPSFGLLLSCGYLRRFHSSNWVRNSVTRW